MSMLVSPRPEFRHASWQQLCLVFVLALLLFVMLRWQPAPWLRSQIDRQARQSGVNLQYSQLDIAGFSVRMAHVAIRAAGLPIPVVLDSLRISPAWSSLLSGAVAVDVEAVLSGQRLDAVLVWQGALIGVGDLNAVLDVAVLQSLWQQRMPLPVHVGGRLRMTGNVQLDAVTGLPVDGQLDALWQQASIDLPVFDQPLGDYHLGLKAVAGTSGRWQWSLGGGASVRLAGSGQLNLSDRRPQQWTVKGHVQLQAAPSARAVAALLGSQSRAFNISGTLLNARLQAM